MENDHQEVSFTCEWQTTLKSVCVKGVTSTTAGACLNLIVGEQSCVSLNMGALAAVAGR